MPMLQMKQMQQLKQANPTPQCNNYSPTYVDDIFMVDVPLRWSADNNDFGNYFDNDDNDNDDNDNDDNYKDDNDNDDNDNDDDDNSDEEEENKCELEGEGGRRGSVNPRPIVQHHLRDEPHQVLIMIMMKMVLTKHVQQTPCESWCPSTKVSVSGEGQVLIFIVGDAELLGSMFSCHGKPRKEMLTNLCFPEAATRFSIFMDMCA